MFKPTVFLSHLCDPNNPFGITIKQVQFDAKAKELTARVAFGRGCAGAKGVAHGGAPSVVLDEFTGCLTYCLGVPTATAELKLTYKKPVFFDIFYYMRCSVISHLGRKIVVQGDLFLLDDDNLEQVSISSTNLFIHLSDEQMRARGQDPGVVRFPSASGDLYNGIGKANL